MVVKSLPKSRLFYVFFTFQTTLLSFAKLQALTTVVECSNVANTTFSRNHDLMLTQYVKELFDFLFMEIQGY